MIAPQRPYTFDRVIRIVFTVVAIIGVFFILDRLKGALLPFFVAWLLAYLINPIVVFYQRRLRIRNRILAIITALASLLLLLGIVGATILPSVIKEVDKTVDVIQSLSHNATMKPVVEQSWYKDLLERIDFDEISATLNREDWTKLIEGGLTHAWTILSGSVNQIISIVSWFIVLLYLIFILLDYQKISTSFRRLIPERYRDITLSIMGDVEVSMNRYFRGQSLIALSVGILFSIGFVIIGIPLAIPLGLFIGMLNMVPYLQIVGIIPTILLCLLDAYNGGHTFWTIFGLSMVVFAVVQSIQDIYITPKVMGRVTGLNPAVILLSLSIWGSLLGILGMIIALPLTTLLLSYYQKYILREES
ncbi:MAG: AI-2E family transporter [Rikenellaceae bacterium]